MQHDRKFTDLDLELDPSLIDTATQYALNYRGGWDVMQCAQQLAQTQGALPLPVARMVLNCMRTDPAAVITVIMTPPDAWFLEYVGQPEPPTTRPKTTKSKAKKDKSQRQRYRD